MEKSAAPTVSFLPLARMGAFAVALVSAPAWPLDLSQAYQAALAQDATIRAVRAATDARREPCRRHARSCCPTSRPVPRATGTRWSGLPLMSLGGRSRPTSATPAIARP
jgi:hypothetical protein